MYFTEDESKSTKSVKSRNHTDQSDESRHEMQAYLLHGRNIARGDLEHFRDNFGLRGFVLGLEPRMCRVGSSECACGKLDPLLLCLERGEVLAGSQKLFILTSDTKMKPINGKNEIGVNGCNEVVVRCGGYLSSRWPLAVAKGAPQDSVR